MVPRYNNLKPDLDCAYDNSEWRSREWADAVVDASRELSADVAIYWHG